MTEESGDSSTLRKRTVADKTQDNNKTNKDNKADDEVIIKNGKRYRRRKQLPRVADLLVEGAAAPPKSFWDMVWGPLVLLVLFLVSFQIFLMAPVHNSKAKQRPVFGMNQKTPPVKRVVVTKEEDQAPPEED